MFSKRSLSVQVATRDRRGRGVMAYTVDGSPTHQLLSSHMAALEKIATERQVPFSLANAAAHPSQALTACKLRQSSSRQTTRLAALLCGLQRSTHLVSPSYARLSYDLLERYRAITRINCLRPF